MGNLGFLTAVCWLDQDGDHVWLWHECTGGWDMSMLPWPRWHTVNGEAFPSIRCDACGLHFYAKVESPPSKAELAQEYPDPPSVRTGRQP